MLQSRFRTVSMLAAAVALVALAATAGAQVDVKAEAKSCKLKTKTMGCAVEDLAGAARATTVVAGGPLPGKCEVDSPAVAPVTKVGVAVGALCDEAAASDSGDAMIALCKSAASEARSTCRAICVKLDKIDSVTGEPVPDTPCRMVVDRTVVTTETNRLGGGTDDAGNAGCSLLCRASIVCVCDP